MLKLLSISIIFYTFVVAQTQELQFTTSTQHYQVQIRGVDNGNSYTLIPDQKIKLIPGNIVDMEIIANYAPQTICSYRYVYERTYTIKRKKKKIIVHEKKPVNYHVPVQFGKTAKLSTKVDSQKFTFGSVQQNYQSNMVEQPQHLVFGGTVDASCPAPKPISGWKILGKGQCIKRYPSNAVWFVVNVTIRR